MTELLLSLWFADAWGLVHARARLLKWEWASWDRLGVWLEPSVGHKKRKDWQIINSYWHLSERMLDRKSDGENFTHIAFVALRGLRIWAARMTKKHRRANFLSRVWSLGKNLKREFTGIFFLSFFLCNGDVEKRRSCRGAPYKKSQCKTSRNEDSRINIT